MLNLFELSDVTLTLKKCHFAYFNIKVLKHYVLRLELSILEKKTKIIRKFQFFKNLKKLNHELEFFNYYRKFVEWYVWIEKSLRHLKIKKFKSVFIKSNVRLRWTIRTKIENFINEKFKSNADFKKRKSTNSETKNSAANSATKNVFLILIFTKKCVRAWKRLKKKLIKTSILIFFDFFCSLFYIQMAVKKKFKIALHQIEKDDVEKSILFLFQSLNDVEIRYEITKLKAEILIWTLIKFSQYFDDESFTVITDHSTLKTALQTKIIDQRSVRFNEWSMYLFTFLSRMIIVHKKKKRIKMRMIYQGFQSQINSNFIT